MKNKQGFQPGQSGNPGGRPPGAKNRATQGIRERITALIEANFGTLEDDFKTLDPEKRLVLLERYLKYSIPPLSSVDIHASMRPELEALTDDQLEELAEKIININKQLTDEQGNENSAD